MASNMSTESQGVEEVQSSNEARFEFENDYDAGSEPGWDEDWTDSDDDSDDEDDIPEEGQYVVINYPDHLHDHSKEEWESIYNNDEEVRDLESNDILQWFYLDKNAKVLLDPSVLYAAMEWKNALEWEKDWSLHEKNGFSRFLKHQVHMYIGTFENVPERDLVMSRYTGPKPLEYAPVKETDEDDDSVADWDEEAYLAYKKDRQERLMAGDYSCLSDDCDDCDETYSPCGSINGDEYVYMRQHDYVSQPMGGNDDEDEDEDEDEYSCDCGECGPYEYQDYDHLCKDENESQV